MYKLVFHAKAKKDIDEIARYITDVLSNPTAAAKLVSDMVNAANGLIDLPYINSVYLPYHPLKREYRKLVVKNYIMFYYINEKKKLVKIARVIYSGRDHNKRL